MHKLHTVYDFGNRFPALGYMLIPLAFVGAGLAMYWYNKRTTDSDPNQRTYKMVAGIGIASFAGIIFLCFLTAMLVGFFKMRQIYNSKQYQVVEGIVEDYHPMPYSGHDSERFTVKDETFSFSDYTINLYGYNTSASHGGAIRAGLSVRICYISNGSGNIILKLETE